MPELWINIFLLLLRVSYLPFQSPWLRCCAHQQIAGVGPDSWHASDLMWQLHASSPRVPCSHPPSSSLCRRLLPELLFVSSAHSWSASNRGVGGEDGRGSVAAELAVHHSSRMHGPRENREINNVCSAES